MRRARGRGEPAGTPGEAGGIATQERRAAGPEGPRAASPMKTMRWPGLCVAGLGLGLALLSGCQAWTSTPWQTLPTGRYLQHPPQYIPPSPPFPLPRELAAQEAAAAAAAAAAAPAGAQPL